MRYYIIAVGIVFTLVLMFVLISTAQMGLRPTDEQTGMLMAFDGVWRGDAAMEREGNISIIEIEHQNTLLPHGRGMEIVETWQLGDTGQYIAYGLVGHDVNDGMIHFLSIDNMGAARDFVGHWTGDKALVLGYTGKRQGRAIKETLAVNPSGENEYGVFDSLFMDDSLSWVIRATLRRQ